MNYFTRGEQLSSVRWFWDIVSTESAVGTGIYDSSVMSAHMMVIFSSILVMFELKGYIGSRITNDEKTDNIDVVLYVNFFSQIWESIKNWAWPNESF